MNKQIIKLLNQKADKVLRVKNLVIWPILGGSSMFTGNENHNRLTRNLTIEEQEILQKKSLPVPIAISLEREKEFQECLKS